MSEPHAPALKSTWLDASGVQARWERDPLHDGAWVLFVGGAEQSTLVPGHPQTVIYEYLARVAKVTEVVLSALPEHRRAGVLHLGGGALTLPRFVESLRPGTRQVVVDLDSELMPFVLEAFPLAAPEHTELIIDDVLRVLPRVGEPGGFDLCVLDIAMDQHSPDAFFSVDYARELLATVTPQGTVIVNVGDDPGLPATRRLVGSFQAAGASVWVTGPSDMLGGEGEGNLLLLASHTPWGAAQREEVRAAGPHPAGLSAGMDLRGLGF
ncbi:spermidine synthase [Galactobacter caseinivorans]|uniref:SAM-dependent methyltransferase n=1 Tax=Galactobacter caseinivorans TaxID=2676123 RepID=A0A496PGR3_9MICC|nr:fused MFS/spermidine synthase [Galactobacter caseinivorans]RKW69674.1 SAM-dependent methyltransferase [Galactobacter caseinivorans]